MCPSTFGELLEHITPLVQRENTNMREAMPTKQRLFATLRFLVSGHIFENLEFETAIAAQPDCCATKFKPASKSSNSCTESQTTPHTIKQFAQQPVWRKLFDRVWGNLHNI
jgi:hypothetical protein